MRSTIRAYWAAWTAVGVSLLRLRQVGSAADRLELLAPLERLRDRDDVDRLAPLEQVEDRGVDAAVGLAIEVLRPQELGDLDDGIAVDEDRAEHGLLGFETLRRQAIDHGVGRTPTGGMRASLSRRRRDRSTKAPHPRTRVHDLRTAVGAAVDNPVDIHRTEIGARTSEARDSTENRAPDGRGQGGG